DKLVTGVQTCALPIFYYGLVRALADEPRPVWTRLPFAAAAANFDAACRYGIDAGLHWPRRGRAGGIAEVPAVRLVRQELLPLARSEERRVGKECSARG